MGVVPAGRIPGWNRNSQFLLPQAVISSGSRREEHPGILRPAREGAAAAPRGLRAFYARVTPGLHPGYTAPAPSQAQQSLLSQLTLQAINGAAPELLCFSSWLDVPTEGTGKGWQRQRGHRGGRSPSLAAPGARSPLPPSPKSPAELSPLLPLSRIIQFNPRSRPAALQSSRQLQRFPDAGVIPKKSRVGDGRGWQRHPKKPAPSSGGKFTWKSLENSRRGLQGGG